MELLFMNGELDVVLRATQQKLLEDVEGWDPDQLLTQSENEVAAYLVEKHTAHCPILKRHEMYADEPADVKQVVRSLDRSASVPATRLQVHVPYAGERIFFSLRPSTFTYNPRADVTESEVVLTFEERQLDGDRVRVQLDRELGEIEQWLSRSREMAERHNVSLLDIALSPIRQRRRSCSVTGTPSLDWAFLCGGAAMHRATPSR